MDELILEQAQLEKFCQWLAEAERSALTIEKYLRDLKTFKAFLGTDAEVTRQRVIDYKQFLTVRYAPASVNSMLAAMNAFFSFAGYPQFRVKPLRLQRRMFSEPEKELTREEYIRLLQTARNQKNERLYLLMETICATGIRVSEVRFITVESLRTGRVDVCCKGKRRTVFLVRKLRKELVSYVKRNGIKTGCVFVTRFGRAVSRHHIWADMKALCRFARVDPAKVFPHNLRHLFARTFYAMEKDLGRLADLLGHSNINTTRIYTRECGREHERLMARMCLVI
ncbi:tyrosine-type recombinase/integrase [Agathobaculum sp.]|uniref:tyrosine-type recombinase/integrase n=1 Tax=Agathobaculum sp. TaxID=2048138 RepID=UPI002A837206|nr:tyrosine-type recombinase/integrase [Agathobaculum sp.]MDY3618344.1 tyrosine-type recombinase/integrase [Agathobaculum sp.]